MFRNYCSGQYASQVSEKVFTVSVLFHTLLTNPVGILRTRFITFCMPSCSVISDSFAILWTAANQTPLSMEFLRQEYWSGCHFLLQGIFLTQGSTCVPCIGRQILYHWATWEALLFYPPLAMTLFKMSRVFIQLCSKHNSRKEIASI